MQLRVMGPIEVAGPSGPVDLGARPARLLVALFSAEGHRLELDALVERGFDDDDRPDDPLPAIRTAIRRLRRAIGDELIVTRPSGFEEAHLLALEGWHDAHLRNGTATEIISSLEAATIDHPTRERLHRQLMQAL